MGEPADGRCGSPCLNPMKRNCLLKTKVACASNISSPLLLASESIRRFSKGQNPDKQDGIPVTLALQDITVWRTVIRSSLWGKKANVFTEEEAWCVGKLGVTFISLQVRLNPEQRWKLRLPLWLKRPRKHRFCRQLVQPRAVTAAWCSRKSQASSLSAPPRRTVTLPEDTSPARLPLGLVFPRLPLDFHSVVFLSPGPLPWLDFLDKPES